MASLRAAALAALLCACCAQDTASMSWYGQAGAVPSGVGCTGASDDPVPIAGDWSPLHFLVVRPGEYLIVGQRRRSAAATLLADALPVRPDVLHTVDGGASWRCAWDAALPRPLVTVRAGASVFVTGGDEDAVGGINYRAVCVVGGRELEVAPPLAADGSDLEAATAGGRALKYGSAVGSVACTSLQVVDGSPRAPGPWVFRPVLPSAVVGATPVTWTTGGRSYLALVGGYRLLDASGIWVATRSPIPGDVMPHNWVSLRLVGGKGGAPSLARLQPLVTWGVRTQQLIVAAGGIDLSGGMSAPRYLEGDAPVGEVDPGSGGIPTAAQQTDVLAIAMPSAEGADPGGNASALGYEWVGPHRFARDVAGGVHNVSGVPTVVTPHRLQLPAPRPRDQADTAYALSTFLPLVDDGGKVDVVLMQVGSGMQAAVVGGQSIDSDIGFISTLAHRAFGAASDELAAWDAHNRSEARRTPSPTPLADAFAGGSERRLRAPGAQRARALVDIALVAVPPLAVVGPAPLTDQGPAPSLSVARWGDSPFGHVLAASRLTGQIFLGSLTPCRLRADCPAGSFPTLCRSSPFDSGCERCNFCDAAAPQRGLGWDCRTVNHTACARCVACPAGFTTEVPCGLPSAANRTHDTCRPGTDPVDPGDGGDPPVELSPSPAPEGAGGPPFEGGETALAGPPGSAGSRRGAFVAVTALVAGVGTAAVAVSWGLRRSGKLGLWAAAAPQRAATQLAGAARLAFAQPAWVARVSGSVLATLALSALATSGGAPAAVTQAVWLLHAMRAVGALALAWALRRVAAWARREQGSGGAVSEAPSHVLPWGASQRAQLPPVPSVGGLGGAARLPPPSPAEGGPAGVAVADAAITTVVVVASALLRPSLQQALLLPPPRGAVKRPESSGRFSGEQQQLPATTTALARAIALHALLADLPLALLSAVVASGGAPLAARADRFTQGMALLGLALQAALLGDAALQWLRLGRVPPSPTGGWGAGGGEGSSVTTSPLAGFTVASVGGVAAAGVPPAPARLTRGGSGETPGMGGLRTSDPSADSGGADGTRTPAPSAPAPPVAGPGAAEMERTFGLLALLTARARTPEGRRLAGMKLFFRTHPRLLPEAVAAVSLVPLPQPWRRLLCDLEQDGQDLRLTREQRRALRAWRSAEDCGRASSSEEGTTSTSSDGEATPPTAGGVSGGEVDAGTAAAGGDVEYEGGSDSEHTRAGGERDWGASDDEGLRSCAGGAGGHVGAPARVAAAGASLPERLPELGATLGFLTGRSDYPSEPL